MFRPIPYLAELSWVEARDVLAQHPVGLLPVGAIEAHGPHLPLDTDVIIAIATARRAAERLSDQAIPAIVLPAIHYTVSFVGTSFPGTSPVDVDAFTAYLTGVLTNAATQGYRGLIVCNAHLEPAHVECIQVACKHAEVTTEIPVRSFDQRSPENAARLSNEFQAGARHAGSYETSILLAVAPDRVRRDAMENLEPVWIDLPAKLRAGARTFADAGAELGYFGDPAKATAAEGHEMLDALAEMVVSECRSGGMLRSQNQS